MTFKELVYKIHERIKNEPYFRWPRKMGGDRRNQSCIALTIELVKAGHLKEFVVN